MMETELQSVEGFYPLPSSFFPLGVEVDLRRSGPSSMWLGQAQDGGPWALSAVMSSLQSLKGGLDYQVPGPVSSECYPHADCSPKQNTLRLSWEHGGARRFCVCAALLGSPASICSTRSFQVVRCEKLWVGNWQKAATEQSLDSLRETAFKNQSKV